MYLSEPASQRCWTRTKHSIHWSRSIAISCSRRVCFASSAAIESCSDFMCSTCFFLRLRAAFRATERTCSRLIGFNSRTFGRLLGCAPPPQRLPPLQQLLQSPPTSSLLTLLRSALASSACFACGEARAVRAWSAQLTLLLLLLLSLVTMLGFTLLLLL